MRWVVVLVWIAVADGQVYLDKLPGPPEGPFENRVNGMSVAFDLAGVLKSLGISVDSQILVFSKTSVQASKISPQNPRAIYFSDDVAVASVRGSDEIEVAATDARKGVVFYALKPEAGKATLTRREDCLHCHQGAATLGVPGIFVGSVYPGPTGLPDRLGAIITDQRTPFADRWGGWYVDAKHGQQPDRSNAIAPDPEEPHVLEARGVRRFNVDGYLSPSSDIVALMTFEHQTQMTNLLTRLGWEARLGRDTGATVESVARYMLFLDEVPLREPVEGVSSFTRTFPDRGPRDRSGRSLRDFDLRTRLFRYPLSYMIYSASFDALPETTRDKVYRALFDACGRLPAEDRRAILEILRDTKAGLPVYYGRGSI